MVKQSRTQCLSLDGAPVDPETLAEILGDSSSLTDAFRVRIFEALNRYDRGNFAVAPESCDYCDFKACCRHAASLLDPEARESAEES